MVTQIENLLKPFYRLNHDKSTHKKGHGKPSYCHTQETLRIKKNKGPAFQNYDDKYMCMEFCENICFSTNSAESRMLEFAILKI